ncbi:MAG TPA: NAD(P)H-dependent glycerol-3-phosphate dehydrogenase [Candidatus Methanoperedens sp.]|nr:NAD(P)H-dependent glycerol-3-phosphate dehydrogenase [Candidatus Methanoperedens sp.]
MKAQPVAVVGAGSWGTALAHHLAGCGHAVRLWCFEPEVAEAIARERANPLFLPGISLHAGVRAFSDMAEALSGAAFALFVTPSHVARLTLRAARAHLPPGIPLLVATKGLETETFQTMAEVFAGELAPGRPHPLAFVSGPSFAREVAAGLPTAVTVASRDAATARAAQELLSSEDFRAYTTDDVVGVEIGGALKNVVAIAAGIGDGLGLGHNARSALITRGLAEMARLGVARGARPATFAGLAGLGDLVLTCTGDLSRNRSLGMALAAGRTLPQIQAATRTVAEGVRTTAAAVQLAAAAGIELPIAAQVQRVLFEGASPRTALHELMTRSLKDETD